MEAYVGTGRCYAVFTNDMIDYKDVAESNDTSETFAALLVNLRYGMSFTPLSILPSTWLSLAFSLLTLVLVTVSFLCRWLWRNRLQQAYQEGYDAAWNEHRQEMTTIRALPILFDHMNEEMERYVRNRDIWIDGDQQRDLAIPICRRALHEATNHADMCPWNDRIWMSRDGLWHTDPMCESLPRGQEMRRNRVWVAQPCGRCMPTPVTPYFVDRFGTTLHDELETWITDQGAEAWHIEWGECRLLPPCELNAVQLRDSQVFHSEPYRFNCHSQGGTFDPQWTSLWRSEKVAPVCIGPKPRVFGLGFTSSESTISNYINTKCW